MVAQEAKSVKSHARSLGLATTRVRHYYDDGDAAQSPACMVIVAATPVLMAKRQVSMGHLGHLGHCIIMVGDLEGLG